MTAPTALADRLRECDEKWQSCRDHCPPDVSALCDTGDWLGNAALEAADVFDRLAALGAPSCGDPEVPLRCPRCGNRDSLPLSALSGPPCSAECGAGPGDRIKMMPDVAAFAARPALDEETLVLLKEARCHEWRCQSTREEDAEGGWARRVDVLLARFKDICV